MSPLTYLPHSPQSRALATRFARLLTLILAAYGLLFATSASAANIIHEFYVPMPEAQTRTALVSIEPAAGIVGTTMESVISIVITGTGTVVHYDEWEDGYEVDINNPTQSTTKIWGDGNNANGVPPGYTNDPASLTSGSVINMRNQITLPRNPATILYDGRDRFGGTKALVVTRTGWAVAPGTVLAGSVEVTPTMDYGTNYIVPVGQDVSAASMFEYVGLMVLARENGTSVTVDINGTASGGSTTVTLNQGESYLANGGVLKGATVTASKPVQTQLITGDIGARYETDWFTLVPTDQWSSTYYSPVGTAADGDATFGFFYNPNGAAITVDVTTCLGTSSFSVPAAGVYQYQMPKNCGSKFTSTQNFFGIVMVGANPTANNVHDWGFTLVPSDSLTTEAVVGWGPGSSDLSANGSPVWVTPIADTTIYVDYNGDRNGPNTDSKGNKYDALFPVAALSTKLLTESDKDQSAMRVYTLDGTLITAAWGQDPNTAGPGNPFLDVGTTVLPFPVPTLVKTFSIVTDVAPTGLSVNDTVEYKIDVDNKGLLPLGNLLVLDPLNTNLTYVAGTTKRDGVAIADNTSPNTFFPLDETGYTIPIIMRGGTTSFSYRCTINPGAVGSIANTASNNNYNLVSTAEVVVPPTGGSTACGAQFTDSSGVLQTTFSAGNFIYATLNDPDANHDSGVAETITITVNNTSNGDSEFVTLVETGVATGVFRNTAGLSSSTTSGTNQLDNTLFVAPGNSLSFSYTDPEFNETCSGTATISVPTQNKYLYLDTDGSDGDTAGDLDRVDPAATSDGSTSSTGVLSVPSGGTITVGTTSSATVTGSTSTTFTHNANTGTDRLLVLTIAMGTQTANPGTPGTISSVSFAGTAMTQVSTAFSGDGARAYIYVLKDDPGTSYTMPTSGAFTINSSQADTRLLLGATTYSGVHQTTSYGAATTATSSTNSTAIAVGAASAANELVVALAALDEGVGDQSVTTSTTGGQSQLWNIGTNNFITGAASTKPGAAGTVTSNFTASPGSDWAAIAFSLKPAPASGGSSSATFTQTPSFASTFTMPSGSTPIVTNYYSVSSGTMPGTPSITAALRKNGTTFATSTGASASGGLLTFTFGALGSAQTFAASDVMSLLVTTAQSGVTFTLDYDSSSKPSKITLPTTTVINVDSLGVYDAPYPGGNLVTGPASGTTVFIRSTVSDPFGAADITSLGLNVDGPGTAADLSSTLTAPNVVNTATGTKTYEYAWAVGSTTGTYNIAVTANEGTEGITATRATSVNVTFLDLGTPSITEFTTGADGPGTPTYAGNEQVCVRVTDLDQNLSATTAETIQATITSLAGDSELVTLTETGVNTGVFVFCIPASTGASNTFNDGTLHAILGDVLTVTYVDPTDSTDTGTDTATIPNINPALTVNKTLLTPADGQALIGEAISYQVQVINTGNTTLNGITLVDTYPAAKLTFISSSTTPNTTASGSLTWNIGTMSSGQSVTYTLNFTALGTAAPATNTATATATGGTSGSDTADVIITDPKISISKSLLSPNPGPANIGDNVTFRIVVTNTGDTAIATLPLEDTYSGADFDFVSATLPPDASGNGSLLWLDATGAGSLAPTGTVTIDVVLKANGAAAPATNLIAANYTVDVNGDSAPPVSSSASITLLAAKISGHVYDDVNQNGAYNPPGDSILEGITVSLYSDPNGDGNPADGVLVGITTTDASGAYEFLNLPAGDYVIVESQPPGYSSHSDTAGANDNRIPVDVVALTTYASNDFFDFQTPAVSYASIAGKVWNDADASTTVNGGEAGIENISIDLVEDTNNNGTADPGEPIVASTLTGSDGSYYFGGLSAGNYVVLEHDLYGWHSTADSASPNNNQIPATLTAGQNATGKDFLDVQTGTTGGKVFHDVNGNGIFEIGMDSPLANVDVIITSSLGVPQTVTTDSNGDWTATLPPGTATVDVQQSDPQFVSVFPAGSMQTAGTDTSTVTITSGSFVSAGDDGFKCQDLLTNGSFEQGVTFAANADKLGATGNAMAITTTTGDPVTGVLGSYSVQNAIDGAWWVQSNKAWDGTHYIFLRGADNCLRISEPSIFGVTTQLQNNVNYQICVRAANTESIPSLLRFEMYDSAGGDYLETYFTLPAKTSGWSEAPGNTTPIPWQCVVARISLPANFAPATTAFYLTSRNDDNSVPGIVLDGLEICPDPTITTGIGNLVFRDANNNGVANLGEGVNNVVVELYRKNGASYDYMFDTRTVDGGHYTFLGLSPGTYQVRIPASQFTTGMPLVGSLSIADGATGDDDAGEDGVDSVSPSTTGISSADVVLAIDGAPDSTSGETGIDSNSDAFADNDIDLTVDFGFTCPVITLDPTTLPSATIGSAYTQTITATGGGSPYTYAVTSGSLPAGITLSAGVLSGTPTQSGSFPITITATDTNGCQGSRSYTLTVLAGTITGFVKADNDNDDDGDTPLVSVTLTLKDSNGDDIDSDPGTAGVQPTTTTTANDGSYSFAGLPPGTYRVVETDPSGYSSITSNTVTPVVVSAGATTSGIDFVDEQPGSITGSVKADIDNDDDGDTPLGSVTLTLKDSNGDDIDSDPGTAGVQPTTTTTLSDGSYSFPGLPPGTYRVVETDPSGYSSVTTNTVTPVVVSAGATTSGIDFVDEQPGSITGSVKADIDNDDDGDTPLVSVTLTLKDSNGDDIDSDQGTAGVQPTTTTTLSDGSYSFPDLPPGTYRVVETDPSGYVSVSTNTVTPVDVTAGATTSNINFVDEQTATISGIVFSDADNDGDGDAAVESVTLTLYTDPNGDGDPADGAGVGFPVQTDSNGVYSFSGLTPGNYVVVQTPVSGYLPVEEGDMLPPKDEPDDSSDTNLRIPVTVTAGETDDGNNFIMELTASIGNLVWNDTNNNGLKDGAETGISGVVVELLTSTGQSIDSNSTLPGVQPTLTTTDGDGLYAFSGIAPGSYQLRISTPPSAYPLSSSNTDTNDNAEDNDDNGIQSTATAPVTSPVFVLSAGDTDVSMDFGFTAITGTYSISGQVRDDYDLDGSFSDSDQPVANVTVKLYADTNDNGIFDDGTDLLITSTQTTGLGTYSFTGLPNGKYFVQEIDPRTASSTADTEGSNDNLIVVTIAGSNSANNDFLDAVDPHGYIYSPVTGQIIAGGSISVSGPGAVTIVLDGSTGQYSFLTDGTPGIYTMTYAPPLGYMIDPSRPVAGTNFDPTGGPSPTVLGSAESTSSPGYLVNFTAVGNPYYLTFDLAAGDPLVINNNIPLVEIKPSTFAAWQYANPLGGNNGPTDDPDGDGFTNLEEFAFCFSPGTGVGHGCPLKLVPQADNSVNATLRRLAQSTGLTYTLQSLSNLSSSPGGWTDVTTIVPTVVTNGDGTETATFTGVDSLFPGGQGFLRVEVTDTVSSTSVYTDVKGFSRRTYQVGCVTCSIPYVKCAAATGAIDSVSANNLMCTTSAGSSSIVAALASGKQYYVEITSGDHEGHRLEVDEASTTATSIAIDTASTLSTMTTLPSTLAGDSWSLREHQTLSGLFPPSKFSAATSSPATASRVLMHDGTAFKIYWLWSNSGNPRWVDVSDTSASDAGGTIISPAAGFFVHPKGAPVTLVFEGTVRANDFVCPLGAGLTLVGGGWPIDQSPNDRAMTAASGFTGSRKPTQADKVMLWRGDINPSFTGYNLNSFLTLASVNRWASEADASLTALDNTDFLQALRAAFIKVQTAKPTYTMPLPWTP